jgi:hypothetical protein
MYIVLLRMPLPRHAPPLSAFLRYQHKLQGLSRPFTQSSNSNQGMLLPSRPLLVLRSCLRSPLFFPFFPFLRPSCCLTLLILFRVISANLYNSIVPSVTFKRLRADGDGAAISKRDV